MAHRRSLAGWQLLATLPLALAVGGCEEKPAPPATPGAAKPAATPTPAPPAPVVPARPAAGVAPAPAAAPASGPALASFPAGQATAEGVACDFIRAYIGADSKLLRACCFVITPGSPERDAYNNFIDETATQLDVAAGVPSTQAEWPTGIVTLFKARELSSPGPAAYGLDQLGLTAVRFVDVKVTVRGQTPAGAEPAVRRLLVVQDEGSKHWFVVPHPENFPKLCEGLMGESASGEMWKP